MALCEASTSDGDASDIPDTADDCSFG
eukprot:SAG22_NODE_2841_length_2163_cov_1.521802_3_plen_26_part_01